MELVTRDLRWRGTDCPQNTNIQMQLLGWPLRMEAVLMQAVYRAQKWRKHVPEKLAIWSN